MANSRPRVTIVTPVYNAGKYLQEAYESLLRQSFKEWHWSVVDDGSTDGCAEMLDEWQRRDARITVVHQSNSGSAKQPRDRAVRAAKAPLLLMFDADDTLSDDYLETMISRMEATDADIVYPVLQFEENGICQQRLPDGTIDETKVFCGRELVASTLCGWSIGCGGGLYRRHIWVNMSSEDTAPAHLLLNSDEVDERLYLLQAQRVAFAPAVYHYRQYGQSITTAFSAKRFERLNTNRQLTDIILREFGTASKEWQLMQRQNFCTWRSGMALFAQNHKLLGADEQRIRAELLQTFKSLSISSLTLSERIQFLGLCHFGLIEALFHLRYNLKR